MILLSDRDVALLVRPWLRQHSGCEETCRLVSGQRNFYAQFQSLTVGNSHRRVAFLPFVRTRFKSLIQNKYDFEPGTIGEHIKKRRLILNRYQKQLAILLKVNEITIVHWEKGKTKPGYRYLPRIIEFLGYDPEPMVPTSLPELLKTKRKEMGWTISEASRISGVDPTTWSRWEWGRIPIERHKLQICFLLGMPRALLNETLVPRADPGSM